MKRVVCGQKIRNEMCLLILRRIRNDLIFCIERFQDLNNPDKPSQKIIDMLNQLDNVVLEFLVENTAKEVIKKIKKNKLDEETQAILEGKEIPK